MDKPRAPGTGNVILAAFLFLGLLAALFVLYKSWLRPQQIAHNERSASFALKYLATAEADFRANDRDQNGVQDFWTGDVATLFRYGLIEHGVAQADAAPLVPGGPPIAYRGYYFVAMRWDESESPREDLRQGTDRAHHPSKFAFCAYPMNYGVTGRATFILNQGNTILWRYTDEEPLDHWPSDQDLRHEWAKGD